MVSSWKVASLVLAGLATISAPASPPQSAQESDRLCRMLFDEYVVGGGKVNHTTLLAATHIVAERGRTNGFWKEVFEALRTENVKHQIACVRLLGKMLEADALARDSMARREQTGRMSQSEPSVLLEHEVVSELIGRARTPDPNRLDHYATALVRARVPEARATFLELLTPEQGRIVREHTQFRAALGLAQLGESAGYEWLVAHTASFLDVPNAIPAGVRNSNLGSCCIAALQHLARRSDLSYVVDWRSWWEQVDKKELPRGRVDLIDQ